MATHFSILAGESHRQRNLAGYSPQSRTESDTTKVTQHTHCSGGNYYSLLRTFTEFPLDSGLLRREHGVWRLFLCILKQRASAPTRDILNPSWSDYTENRQTFIGIISIVSLYYITSDPNACSQQDLFSKRLLPLLNHDQTIKESFNLSLYIPDPMNQDSEGSRAHFLIHLLLGNYTFKTPLLIQKNGTIKIQPQSCAC